MKTSKYLFRILFFFLLIVTSGCKKDPPKTLPEVSTTEISNITSISASSGGTITDDGNSPVSSRGVCWSINGNPTISDNKTSDGKGTGIFTSSIIDLSPGKLYYVRAYATNAVGTAYGSQLSMTTMSILPILTTTELIEITPTTATGGGNVTNDGGATVTAKGVCWSTTQNPTTADSKTNDGSGTGSFSSSITDLSPGKTYYIRAYATNSMGTAYGNQVTGTTSAVLPALTTTEVFDITPTTATSGGNVTNDGGATVTAKGVCWSTTQNPTTADSKTNDGSGTGSFSSSITGLTPNTTYYVRAYAINSQGTAYGTQISFKTGTLTTVVTEAVTDVLSTTATYEGNVTDDGGATITLRGFCWSTSQNPTRDNSLTYFGPGTGVFTKSITGLTPSTTYYVRAFAINSQGTAYGNEVCFTTKNFSPAISEMLLYLPSSISSSLYNCERMKERNPHIIIQLQEKIDMLKRPTLYDEIIEGRFFAEDSVTSANGRHIPIIAVFTLEIMRHDASQSVTWMKNALPILEDFMKTPWPKNFVRNWYGFTMGAGGGGGEVRMEDKYTYEARTPPNTLPYYEAVLYHELSHTYIGNESLTQFLEIYIYNIIHTKSTNFQLWIYLRWNYTAFKAGNSGVDALLDIYQLIGHDGMSKAYKELYSLKPNYGEPLSTECKQVFVNHAPANQKNHVYTILGAAGL